MEAIITKRVDNWTLGYIGPFRFEIKHFDEPSVFGINEGRISKLWLKQKDGFQIAAAYERGWDKRPETKEAQDAVDTLCAIWN